MEESELKPAKKLTHFIAEQVLSHFSTDSYGDHFEDTRKLHGIYKRVWVEFSQRNQKSPSRRNNNVHRNETVALHKPSTRSRIALFPKTSHDQPENPNGTSAMCSFDETPIAVSERTQPKSVFHGNFVWVLYILATSLSLYCGITYHRPLQNFASRNVQDYIYPFMRFSRLMAVPLVKSFPFLTTIYEESCLFANPRFGVSPSECWPCENARSIVDLTGLSNLSAAFYATGMPFFIKNSFDGAANTETAVQTVVRHYGRSDEPTKSWLSNFFSNGNEGHFAWKLNQVSLVRMLRQYFPKPCFVPRESEVSVQHFLFVDKFNYTDYHFPVTEFANVFVMQAHGARIIRLSPVGSCRSSCRTLNMILNHNEVLYYNWLYWHATSRPTVSSTSVGITYMGSFY